MNIPELDLIVLKNIISNKKNALDFANECEAKVFSPEAWNMANIIVGYIRTYKDIPTLRVIVEKLSKGHNDRLVDYIKEVWTQLENTKIDDREYKHELEKIKRRFAQQQIISVNEKLTTKLNSGVIDISQMVSDMQKAVQSIKGLDQVKAFERKTVREAVPTFREEYNAKLKDPTFDRGIYTGYSYLDYVTDGFRSGELVLVGGESGGGKSMLLMNMAIQMWLQQNTIDMTENWKEGNHVVYFSLEMPYKPCYNRFLSRLSGNKSKKIRAAQLDSDEALQLKKVLKFITKYPYEFEIIDIPRGATMESLELIYEDIKVNYDPKIIVIDYMGLMDYEGGEMDDWLKLGKIAEKIHEFARVHNCIVLSAVQLNRAKATKTTEDKIGLHRIGRSAIIMHNANIAIQIETRPNEKDFPDMIYHLIKNRDGSLGSGRIIKNLACGTLTDDKSNCDDMDDYFIDVDDISDKIEL